MVKVEAVAEPEFTITLTHRQMQLINLLRSRGGEAKRRQLFWEFGPAVDNVAAALMQKGLVEREVRAGQVVYKLTKMGDA